MKLKKLYEKIVQEGINSDPRGQKRIKEYLDSLKSVFEKLTESEKKNFDAERLKNPYDDTRMLFGDPETEIKTIAVGIDIDTPELLLIDRLNASGKNKIDLALSHHPQGNAYASFYNVMDIQSDIFNLSGVPVSVAEKLVQTRKNEVKRRVHAANHQRTVNAAKLLNIPMMCAHTAADNHVVEFLQELINKKKPVFLKDAVEILMALKEYKIASDHQAGPQIINGSSESRAGRIFIDMTGGTEGPKEIAENLSAAGISTVIGMHMSEEHYKKFSEKNINIIIAGHIASDNLGINLLLDKIEKTEKLNIVEFSGFQRVKR